MIEPRRGWRGRIPLLPPLLIAVVVVSGCGIPSAAFVGPPAEADLQDPESLPVVTFDHNVEANDTEDFKGYELYYRFYDDEDSATDYEQDRDQILATPIQPGPTLLEDTAYRRVVASPGEFGGAGATQEQPLIAVPPSAKSQEFEVTLSFGTVSTVDPAEASANWLGTQLALARSGAQDDSELPKGFILGAYNGTEDQDLQGIARSVDEVIFAEELYVALYGLGYGIDGLTFDQIYSEPAFLGYFKLVPAP